MTSHVTAAFPSSVCTSNTINQEGGAQKFQNFKTGTENGGQGRKFPPASESQQGAARIRAYAQKMTLLFTTNKEKHSHWCQGLKLQVGGTVQKLRSSWER